MIHIKKDFNTPPQALIACAESKRTNLLERKDRHQFEGSCYKNATIHEFRKLYASLYIGVIKCAYCESLIYITNPSGETIEHYRPKGEGLYYWLAYEWSNLLPVCSGCNGIKSNRWEARGSKIKSHPSNIQDWRADSELMLSEKPSCLHPEIDNPSDFLTLNIKGELEAIDENHRAKWTIDNIGLNKRNLPQNRIKSIASIHKLLKSSIINLFNNYKIQELQQDNRLLAIALNPVFEKLVSLAHPQNEYSFVGLIALQNPDKFIWDPLRSEIVHDQESEWSEIAEKMVEWIKYYFELWIIKNIN